MSAFLEAAVTLGGAAAGHLALRRIAGCNTTRFAALCPSRPMEFESFRAPAAAMVAAGRDAHEVSIEQFLLQCAVHVNEEYLVRLLSFAEQRPVVSLPFVLCPCFPVGSCVLSVAASESYGGVPLDQIPSL